jgi:capsular exopolysaccharide synthesis family protein
VIAVGATGVLSATATKQYEATAGLLFRDPGFDQKLFGTTSFSPNSDPAREAATNVRLVSLRAVAARTAQRLGGRLDTDDVARKVKTSAEGQSDVVSVVATDPSREFAQRLANTFATQYIAFRRDADREKIASARALIQQRLSALSPSERTGRQATSLRESADQLDLLASLQQGNAELVQPASLPESPALPRTKRNLALAALVGVLLGVGFALILDRVDRRIRSPDELEELLELPVLGVIPRSGDFTSLGAGGAGSRTADGLPTIAYGSVEGDAFRMLRSRMRYFNVDRSIRSLLITSPSAADGKTTMVLSLAAAAAVSGERVLVIEADLRRPTLTSKTGLGPHAGLAEFLSHEAELNEARRTVGIGDTGASLDVIAAGFQAPNPSDLIESKRMTDLLDAMRSEYDLVIIDTPPLLVVPDAIPLVSRVDGVIVTCRIGATERDRAQHVVTQLKGLDAHLLGIVANGVSTRGAGYYGYDYGYSTVSSDRPTSPDS